MFPGKLFEDGFLILKYNVLALVLMCISGILVCWNYGFAFTARNLLQTSERRTAKRSRQNACPSIRILAWARISLAPALLRGAPQGAVPGPVRLTRRPCLVTPCATPALGLLEKGPCRNSILNSHKILTADQNLCRRCRPVCDAALSRSKRGPRRSCRRLR
jgi:hypothetical protein